MSEKRVGLDVAAIRARFEAAPERIMVPLRPDFPWRDVEKWADVMRDVPALLDENERLREYWGDTLGLVMEVQRLRKVLEEIALGSAASPSNAAREALGLGG